MNKKNKIILATIGSILLVGYSMVGIVAYEYTHKYAENQNKKKLDQILLNQRALHSYLEDHLKPVIYQLKEENKLYNDFFDPKILSFTYIARGIHDHLNTMRQENNTTEIYYKLATDNPRNAINKADPYELKVLKFFRENPNQQQYSEIVDKNGQNYIYYAMPTEKNKQSCMKCHSTPEKAPVELVKLYGTTAGFGESVGHLRAIISLKMPFKDELSEANTVFMFIMGTLGAFLTLLFGAISYFIYRIDQYQKIIEEKNEHLSILSEQDALTGILNRRSFEIDLETFIKGGKVVMVIFDIDYFKKVNDDYGHQTGDMILQKLSSFVRSNLRESDHFYRIGGEEFAILSTDNDLKEMEGIIQRLLPKISGYDFGLSIAIHISAGISEYRENETATSFFRRTDDALYTAKENGRNRYVIAADD